MEAVNEIIQLTLSKEEALAIANDLIQVNVLCDTSNEFITTLGVEKPEIVEEPITEETDKPQPPVEENNNQF